MSLNRGMSRRRGYTLVEMLVVIGIILVLGSILLPTIFSARRNAERRRMAADLQAIAQALEQYRSDFGDYPRPPMSSRGTKVLAWALIAPRGATVDGADGPGFRTVWNNSTQTGSKVYGPYLPIDRFPCDTNTPPAMLDRYGKTIEYFPRWREYKPGMPLFNSYAGGPGLYDSSQAYDSGSVTAARKLLGDVSTNGVAGSNPNDYIDGGEVLTGAPSYLLLSRGPRMTDWNEPVSNLNP